MGGTRGGDMGGGRKEIEKAKEEIYLERREVDSRGIYRNKE